MNSCHRRLDTINGFPSTLFRNTWAILQWNSLRLYILQRGVQWKEGVVVYIILQAALLYNSTPIHCTPLRLHPPLQSIHLRQVLCLQAASPMYHYYYINCTILYYYYTYIYNIIIIITSTSIVTVKTCDRSRHGRNRPAHALRRRRHACRMLHYHLHPVSITRFPLSRFSQGAGLLRSPFFTLSTLRFSRGWVRKDGNHITETGCITYILRGNKVDISNE